MYLDNQTNCLDNRTKHLVIKVNRAFTSITEQNVLLSRYFVRLSQLFGYEKCVFGISITERLVIEVLLYLDNPMFSY